MTMSGVLLMVVSAMAYFWSSNYIGQNALKAGLGSLMGQSDPTYSLATTIATFSPFTFVLGVGLLIAGLVRGRPKPSS